MTKKTVLVCGQPGIAVRHCLRRVVESIPGAAHAVFLEDKMQEVSGREFRSAILDSCLREQYAIWGQGFEAAVTELRKQEKHPATFLSFHAVYHHPRTRDFYCPIDPRRLQRLEDRVKCVVVLVDDIFDIYSRLLQPNEIYHETSQQASVEGLFAGVGNLLEILQWRQHEIAASRWISMLLGVPLVVLATKHNVRTLARMATRRLDQLRLLYLSHPITSIRKQSARYPDFPGEVDEFARRVSRFDNVVLFEPAAIDEFGRFGRTERGLLKPSLTMRWSLSSAQHETIAPPLQAAPRADWCLDPQSAYASQKGAAQHEVHRLLRLLEDQIGVQVGSRDFTLVEQATSGVVAYRPYYPDILSSGAWQELDHNNAMRRLEGATRRKCLVVSVDDDYCRNRITKFFSRLQMYLDIPSEKTEQRLQELCARWLADGDILGGFRVDQDLHRTVERRLPEIEAALPNGYKFRKVAVTTPLGGTAQAIGRANRQEGFATVCRETLEDDIKSLVVQGGVYRPRLDSRASLLGEADALLKSVFGVKEAA